MKISLTVTKLYNYINKNQERFIKIELMKSIDMHENGYVKNKKMVVYYNVSNTILKVGDIFIFDSKIYNMVEKKYPDKNGFKRISRNIYNKPIDIKEF